MEDKMLKVSEAAKRLNITPPTMRRMLASGRIEGVQVTKTTWRIHESVLNAFIKAQGRQTEQA